MAELFMECEEEELEPWQRRVKVVEIDDDDDDEPIFVGEITSSKTATTNNLPRVNHGSSPRGMPNGAPKRGAVSTFKPTSQQYKTATLTQGAVAVSPVYQPASRPTTSSVVQPVPRPVSVSGSTQSLQRPIPSCILTQQMSRTNSGISQPVCRPVTIPVTAQPVSRNISVPVMAQPVSRPVATVTAQPIMLNQSYIMSSSQVPSTKSSGVVFGMRQNTNITQYQGGPALTMAGSSTQLVRPVQPMTQIHPVSSPVRLAPRSDTSSIGQKNINLTTGAPKPLLINSQKPQQTVHSHNSTASIGLNETAFVTKRPASEINSITPKKLKLNEPAAGINSSATLPSVKPVTVASSKNMSAKGTSSTSSHLKNGAPFPRACPKCNIHFNLMDPLKNHMKYCCPDLVNNVFLGASKTETSSTPTKIGESEKGKLIMLVSDFYYGTHEGDMKLVQQEQKTHTTFKCFSCLKVLKNNVRFMNHMKHHLELEKQSSESWENHTTCQHCYRQFPTPFQLQCHIESAHTPYESTTVCKICELAFESEQVLLQHMKDNHKPGEMPYVCQVCGYRSSTFSDVENHFRTAHENTKNLLCPFCLKVIKIGTPYMQHYMRHQKKGIYRCTKCRLQFLTCKEKMDHKTQHHRTYRKPKELEGLPPGTKVTIRASVGPLPAGSSSTSSFATSTSTIQLSPKTKNTTTKCHIPATKSNASPAKSQPPNVQKKQSSSTNSKKRRIVNTALQNLRYRLGVHKCIECYSEIKDFASHFPTYVHCSLCRYSTSCSKAYVNHHMMSFHSACSSRKFWIFKKQSEKMRGMTLVCLNCDFLTDASGLDAMAKHLSKSQSHSCQVVLENVSFSSTVGETISESKHEPSVGDREENSKKLLRPVIADEGSIESSPVESKLKSVDKLKNESNERKQVDDLLERRKEISGSSEVKNDSSKESQDSITKRLDSEKIDCGKLEDTNTVIVVAEQEQTELEICQSSENANLHDQTEGDNLTEIAEPTEVDDSTELKLSQDEGVSFEQFLRKKDEPESISSDISEQGSIHLEPLTPSEVLEHEATEILQKGSVASSAVKTGLVSEQTEDIPKGTNPSEEATLSQTDEDEAS
ncbi:zinc finger protein 280D isoform X2 [Rhinatrema bivittatum]|nr:zinc finger protein 280D isoform X2 [Rhinatrema bivittatum]